MELILCGPQGALPSLQELSRLRQILLNEKSLFQTILLVLEDLPILYKKLTAFDSKLEEQASNPPTGFLLNWLKFGVPSMTIDHLPNVDCLPFAVILQIALLLEYLSENSKSPDLHSKIQSLQHYGVQGFCTGFLTAAAIAFSGDIQTLATNTATSLRLAMCIGAYVDGNLMEHGQTSLPCAVSVRWKEGHFSERQIQGILADYPHAYIACNTDISCITIIVQACDEVKLARRLNDAGLRVKSMGIQGRFHSARDHTAAVDLLKKFTKSVKGLQYPDVSHLKLPLRSNVTGEVIVGNVNVSDVAVESILVYRADWYTTVRKTIDCFLSGRAHVNIFAFEEGVLPLSLAGRTSPAGQSRNGNLKNSCRHLNGANGMNGIRENIETKYPAHSIAVVGMACRFPGATDVNEFWQLLESGVSMVQEVPADRFNVKNDRLAGFEDTKFWGNFIDDIESFDHRFFKKSSREAIAWDPEKRMLLEVVYQALESAGHFGTGTRGFPNDYGCYIGAVGNNYYDNVSCHPPNAYSMLGTSRAFFSGRISHQFGFTGPAMTIDTACSSSLVAINTACRAIMAGECSRAIAGGTNIFSSPFDYQNLAAAGFLSPTGPSKPFDESADGYCRGEGVAAVVLKSLSTAIQEGDDVLGVIVGSAVNQNYNDAHIAVPCASSQRAVYERVIKMANITSESVTYVEAHGTGTQVGDPIECQSIRAVFGGPHRQDTLHFGSVKGNIGHTEASAGVAGLIKVLLMIQHGVVPGQAGFTKLNPKTPALEPDKMAIARTSLPWNTASKIACINSYGAAGSNAVVAIREFKPASPIMLAQQRNTESKMPCCLSASTEGSFIAYARKLLSFLEKEEGLTTNIAQLFTDILFNLADRVNPTLSYKTAKAVSNLADLKGLLNSIVNGTEKPTKDAISSERPVVMVFGGQEKDFVALSKEAVESSGLIRHHLDACNVELQSLGRGDLYPAIYQRESISDLPRLHAALFAAQYASAMSWIESGMNVRTVIGHSFGQLTALCISGCLSIHDAMRLVVGRAELIEKFWGEEKGSMISIHDNYMGIVKILQIFDANFPGNELEFACFNHPANHVLVGTSKAVEAFRAFITSQEPHIRVKVLEVTHGFHSALAENILEGLESLASNMEWHAPKIPIELTNEEHVDQAPGPWLMPFHLRNSVYFSSAVQRISTTLRSCVWVEAGPGSSVMSLVKNCLDKEHQQDVFFPSFLNGPQAISSLTETILQLWKNGIYVRFWPYHRIDKHRYNYKNLPPYQFEKTKHWLPFIEKTSQNSCPVTPSSLLEIHHHFISFAGFIDPDKQEALFLVDPQSERYMHLLKGHIASNQALAPASLYVELLSRAAMTISSNATYDTHVLNITSMQMKGAPIGLDPNKSIYVKLTRTTPNIDSWIFEFSSHSINDSSDNQIHVTGKVGLDRRDDPLLADTIMQWSALIGYKKCLSIINQEDGEKMQGKHIYQALQKLIYFDEMYHGIKSISYRDHEAAGKVAAKLDPNLSPSEALYDTPTIDGMMQFAGVLVNYFAHPSGKDVLLCQGINRIVTGGTFDITAEEWIAYSLLTEDTEERTVSDVYIFDKKSQKVVIAFIGFVFVRTSVSVLQRSLRSVNTGGPGANPITAKVAPEAGHSVLTSTHPKSEKSTFPKASMASRVMRVLHNVTDIPLEEIHPQTTLEDLGIDSLLVTEVLNEIQLAFGLGIDLNAFLFMPNVKAICDHIELAVGHRTETVNDSTPSVGANGGKARKDVVDSSVTTSPDEFTGTTPSLQRAQQVFANCRDSYVRAARETGALGFWEKCYPQQAALVLAYVVEAFSKLDCDIGGIQAGEIVSNIPHLPRHTKLVRQLYHVLEDAGLIAIDEQGHLIRTTKVLDSTPASVIYAKIVPDFPLHATVHKIVRAVGEELAECLTGEKDGLQIVFGNKENKKTLDDLYENWPLVRSGTIALSDFLSKAMSNSRSPGVFRILEVGAGTGGTTKYLVPHLQKMGVPFQYVFTDLSASLVAAAKRTFKEHPEMQFSTLDVEQEPPASWINSFHFIISTNCIHATRDLTKSLTTLRRMLRDDGVLGLVEITKNMFWLDIAVGLFEGWWLFEDGRKHSVTPEWLWKDHMLRAGFSAVDWTDGQEPEASTIRVIAGFSTDMSL